MNNKLSINNSLNNWKQSFRIVFPVSLLVSNSGWTTRIYSVQNPSFSMMFCLVQKATGVDLNNTYRSGMTNSIFLRISFTILLKSCLSISKALPANTCLRKGLLFWHLNSSQVNQMNPFYRSYIAISRKKLLRRETADLRFLRFVFWLFQANSLFDFLCLVQS